MLISLPASVITTVQHCLNIYVHGKNLFFVLLSFSAFYFIFSHSIHSFISFDSGARSRRLYYLFNIIFIALHFSALMLFNLIMLISTYYHNTNLLIFLCGLHILYIRDNCGEI